jgi:NADPH2:quinone reductase
VESSSSECPAVHQGRRRTAGGCVRLSAYGGDATDLPAGVLQDYLDAVATGSTTVPIDSVHPFEDIVEAHRTMEAGRAAGKLVITT